MSADAEALDSDILDTLTPEERAAMEDNEFSPAELAAMQAIAGDDDGSDDDDAGPGDTAAAAKSAQDTAPADTAAATTTATGDDVAPVTQADTSPAEVPRQAATQVYEAKLPDNYQEQVNDLAQKEADLKARFRSGDLEFDQYEAERAELDTQREALTAARIKSEISQEMSEQTAQQAWASAINTAMVDFARPEQGGIDYRTDLGKQADLDQFVRVLSNRTDNADKPMAWFLQEAHKRVLALHDIPLQRKAPAPVVDPVAAAKAKRAAPAAADAPRTLADVPGGDGPGDVAGEFADLDALDGEALEEAIGKMSPAMRDKYLQGR